MSNVAAVALLAQPQLEGVNYTIFWTVVGLLLVVIAILVWIPILHPEILEQPKKDYHAIELVPTPVPVNHTPQRRLPEPMRVAKLDPPPASLRLPAPQPQPKPRVEETPVPEVKVAAKKIDPIPTTAPVMPKQAVRTNVFSTVQSVSVCSSPDGVVARG